MLKIMNLNFQNQTIENIEVNCETITDLEVTLTKTKFKIAFNTEDKIFKKEISVEDVLEEVDVVIEEPVMEDEQVTLEINEKIEVPVDEPLVMQEPLEEPVMEYEPVTLGKMKELLQEQIPKKNTLDSYFRTIQQVYHHFDISDMAELFRTKEQDIIDFIESQYTNNSTIKSKLCSVYKAYKILNIEGELFKNKIDYYATKQTLIQDEKKMDDKKTVEEGEIIIEHFNNKLDELGKTIQDDINLLNNWNVEAQLYSMLKIYLTFGVIRSSELINCKITETDDDTSNYINVKTKQIVINQHKNDKVNGKKVIDISGDKKLLAILRKGLGKYLVTNTNGELYQSSSAFAKVFKKYFTFNVYDLRKSISSKCIAEGDIEKIKKLEHVQGHSLNVILDYYNVYNKES